MSACSLLLYICFPVKVKCLMSRARRVWQSMVALCKSEQQMKAAIALSQGGLQQVVWEKENEIYGGFKFFMKGPSEAASDSEDWNSVVMRNITN